MSNKMSEYMLEYMPRSVRITRRTFLFAASCNDGPMRAIFRQVSSVCHPIILLDVLFVGANCAIMYIMILIFHLVRMLFAQSILGYLLFTTVRYKWCPPVMFVGLLTLSTIISIYPP